MKFMRVVCAGALAVSSVAYGQSTKPAAPPPADEGTFAAALRAAAPGQVIRTRFAKLENLPKLDIQLKPSANAATLVFSDRPEYFRAGDGIASQDTVTVDSQPQRIRFYTYHVPVMTEGKPKRIITVFDNLSDQKATLTFNTYSEPKPSGDYNTMAKTAMADWFKGESERVITLPPHGRYVSDGSKERYDKPDLLVHGLFEFTTDRSLRLSVAQVTAGDDFQKDIAAVDALPKLPMLPYGLSKDKANRGVFKVGDINATLATTYDTASGPAQIVVANGKSDPWQPGIDGISGDPTINKGNYGVAYHMMLHWKSTDRRGVAVLMSTGRFDSDCGYVAAAVKVSDGNHPGGVIELPADAPRFHGAPEACVIQTFASPADGDSVINLTFTPPGACCLPIPILLVPMDQPKP